MSEFRPKIRSAAESSDATSYELIPANLAYAQYVTEILAQADRPLRNKQIRAALEDYPIKPANVKLYLSQFVEAGLIKKFGRGLYGSLEHDDCDIHPADKSITENICDIVEAAGREMSPLEVTAAVSDRCNQAVNPVSIQSTLHRLSNQGRIQRLDRGVYASWDYDRLNYQPNPLISTQIVAIITQAGKPLKSEQILIALKNCLVKPATVKVQLSRLVKAGLIKKFRPGLYGSLEHNDCDIHPADKSITENICDIVEAAGREMSPLEVTAAVSDRCNQAVNPVSIQSTLHRLSNQGRIQRLDRGVYASWDYDRLNYQPNPLISTQIVAIITQAGKPLKSEQILIALKNCLVKPATVKVQLSRLVKAGLIKKFRPGLYGSLEHNDCDIHPADKSITENICDIVEAAGQAMSPLEVTAAVSDRRNQAVNPVSIRSILNQLRRKGWIQRLDRGVYASWDYDRLNYQPNPPIRAQIVAIIEAADRPLAIEAIIDQFEVDDSRPNPSRANIYSGCCDLVKQGRIRRFSRGVYAPADFHSSPVPSETEIYQEQVLGLINSSIDTISITNLRQELGVNLDQKTSFYYVLTCLRKQGLIKRVRRGVYARPDHDGSIDRHLPIREQVIDCLKKSQQSLSSRQIFEIITADGDGPTSFKSFVRRLQHCWLEGRIQKFDDNTYASLDYRPSSDQRPLTRPEKPKPGTLPDNVVQILKEAGGKATVDEIFEELQKIDPKPLSQRQGIINKFPGFVEFGWISRVSRGVYASQDYRPQLLPQPDNQELNL